jgi:hypothetical protein
MGQQQKLFVGYVGEDCVYMNQEQKPAHKTNRDWHLDTSSSDNSSNNMNMEEDSDASDTTRVTSNHTNFKTTTTTTSFPEMSTTLKNMNQRILKILKQKSPKLHHGPMMTWLTTRG